MKKYLLIILLILLIITSLTFLFIGKYTKKIIINNFPKELEVISYENSIFSSKITGNYLDSDGINKFNVNINIQHGPIIWSKEDHSFLPVLSFINYEAHENKQKDNHSIGLHIHGSFKIGFDQKGTLKGNLNPYFTDSTPSSLNIPKDRVEASLLAEGIQKENGLLINKINVELTFNFGSEDTPEKTKYSLEAKKLNYLNDNNF